MEKVRAALSIAPIGAEVAARHGEGRLIRIPPGAEREYLAPEGNELTTVNNRAVVSIEGVRHSEFSHDRSLSVRGLFGADGVARVEHRHVRLGPHHGEVFERHLGRPVLTDRHADVRPHELDVRMADRCHPNEIVRAR